MRLAVPRCHPQSPRISFLNGNMAVTVLLWLPAQAPYPATTTVGSHVIGKFTELAM